MRSVKLGQVLVGPGRPVFVIAEAGVNHNGNLAKARRMVEVAAKAGADAVKFQTFKAERLVTVNAPKAAYQCKTTAAHESQFDMLRRLELSEAAHRELFSFCRKKNILFLSTPFDEQSADFLDALGLAALKVGSGELTNLELLKHIARKQKPMIISTGMATLSEVGKALRVVKAAGNQHVILLHCVSNYPAAGADLNLRAIATLARKFHVPVGFSDHTSGIEMAPVAVALGACVIEKHFTLSRKLPGPDQKCSLEPDELSRMIRVIRMTEEALGTGEKIPVRSERDTAQVARRSLISNCAIPKGVKVTAAMIAVRRPGTGLAPEMLSRIVGRVSRVFIPEGKLITFEMLK